MFKKTTFGYVEQIFDENGNCIEQNFIAEDTVIWEKVGDPLEHVSPNFYHSFEMVQPEP